MTTCSVEGCGRGGKIVRGLCRNHYQSFWYNARRAGGEPTIPNRLHGLSGSADPTYQAWAHMKRRCYAPRNNMYKSYGAKGIRVTDRWRGKLGFINFREDMGTRPVGKYIDRIDRTKDFTPENTVWRTMFEMMYYRSGPMTNIRYDTSINKWTAKISYKGRHHHVGSFLTEEEARAARDKKYAEILAEIRKRHEV